MSAFLDLLLESSVRALAVALLVGAVLMASRSRGSSLRHAAWTFALAAMLLMPVLMRLSPPVTLPAPAMPSALMEVFATDEPPMEHGAATDVAAGLQSGGPAKPRAEGVVGDAGQSGRPRVEAPATISLVQIVLAIWAVGALVCVARLFTGLWWMHRLQRSATQLDVPGVDVLASSSPAAAVPMTVGIFRPRILLPADWSSWPTARLAAVLAHEAAHAHRRDALVLFAAAINRSIFWFHPLAWWLTRTLAATAEEACDAAAIRAIGNARQYAQVLLAIADEARRGHGRVAWAAVGIHGAGRFSQRIDRILRADVSPAASWKRSAAVLAACAAGLLLVVSCRQRVDAVALKEDPEIAQRLAGQKAVQDLWQAAAKMTEAEVAALEKKVQANPEDLEARKKLLIFYQNSGQKVLGWDRTVAARRPHLLWLIEHRPEDDLSVFQRLSPQYDPAGYEQAKALWLAHANKPGVTARLLGSAAYFFENTDKWQSEKLLLRAKALDPNGPTPRIDQNNMYRSPWSSRLGTLYANAILGGIAVPTTRGDYSRVRDEAFAVHARKVLDESSDPTMLLAAGSNIVRLVQSPRPFDFQALGKTYLERANRLDPNGGAGRLLASRDESSRAVAARKEWNAKLAEGAGGGIAQKLREGTTLSREEWRALEDAEPAVVAALPERERFARLPGLASESYNKGESIDYYEHDAVRSKARWDRSKAYAREALALAPKFTSDPGYGQAIYEANVALSINALREGDVKTAVTFLKAAGQAPALTNPLQFGLENKLANYLLKVGERESVAEFLEKSAAINPAQKERFLKDAADIRAGKMPMSYQYMVTPH